ncbi:hypothetical protein [Chryseobacterium indologenes]|uniref:hypothetical protein n=1 Tax=Chryseobacterium indologenes TaxID=253 RepID=UPI0010243E1B|nr:hypothetical protein [Chryseobacterium indologenes]VFA43395.1 Uncharacterised protein [Chryseobacterium indologenes]
MVAKHLHISLLLFLAFSCKDAKTSVTQVINADTVTSRQKTPSSLHTIAINKKWYGIYKVRLNYGEIGGMNAGWDLEINITGENSIASGNGYQIGFKDELTATEEGNKLILKHKKNLDGYTLGKNMDPEFILIEDNGNFYVQSEWIDSDIITKPQKDGFKIIKTIL